MAASLLPVSPPRRYEACDVLRGDLRPNRRAQRIDPKKPDLVDADRPVPAAAVPSDPLRISAKALTPVRRRR
jgi:hypothetical protein